MLQIGFIGAAAGVASALLFASFASGSLLSVPLFYLSPLPILIVGLGWSHLAALTAAFVAASAVGLLFGWMFFLSVLVGVGLPSWWLGYLALLGRPGLVPGTMEWYPVGRLVIWAAVIGSMVTALVLLTIASDAESLRAALRKSFEPLLQESFKPAEGSDRSARSVLRLLAEYPDLILPPAAGTLTLVVSALILWLSGRIVRISGRLPRPWPDLSAMTFPPLTVPALGAALLAATLLPGLAGIYGTIVAAALVTAFAFLGLAVLHALTRRINGRGFILGGVYGALIVFGWPMLLVALLGIADMALDLRARLARPTPPPFNPRNFDEGEDRWK